MLAEKRHQVPAARHNRGGRRRVARHYRGPGVGHEQLCDSVARNRRGGAANNAAALAIAYMPLARARARRATRRYRQDYGDALSDALFGLAQALRRGRPGPTFPAYALKTIDGAILRGIRDRSGLRACYERGGDRPPVVISLDARAVGAMADEEDSPPEQVLRSELWREVDRLPGRQPIEVRLSYQYGLSQTEIGRLLGVTQVTVSRDLARAHEALAQVV